MSNQIIHYKTYNVRGYIRSVGHDRVDEVLEMLRNLYNSALQERKDTHEWQKRNPHLDFPKINKYHQFKQLTSIRSDDERYAALDAQITRGALVRIDRAFNGFFKRIKRGDTPGFPRFQGRGRYDSIELANVKARWFKFSDETRTKGYLKIKGLPNIRFRSNRPLPGTKCVNLIIKMTPKGIVLSITFEHEPEYISPIVDAVGIDMGVTKRMSLSDPDLPFIEKRKLDRRREKRLQRKLSRAKKGSNTRKKKARALKKERYRNRIKNRNECHRITSEITKRYGHIAIEDLQIKNMTRSAKGTVENPGKNVSQKRGLNRSILEQSWAILKQQLEYKAEWAGRTLTKVDPKYTSQTCSACGVIDRDNRKGEYYKCSTCGVSLDADTNAANNILARSLMNAEGWDSALISPTTRSGAS